MPGNITNSEGEILCGTCGQDPANLTLTSVTNATIQSVSGLWVVVGIEVNVSNCDTSVTSANLTMTVFTDSIGNFELTEYNYVSGVCVLR